MPDRCRRQTGPGNTRLFRHPSGHDPRGGMDPRASARMTKCRGLLPFSSEGSKTRVIARTAFTAGVCIPRHWLLLPLRLPCPIDAALTSGGTPEANPPTVLRHTVRLRHPARRLTNPSTWRPPHFHGAPCAAGCSALAGPQADRSADPSLVGDGPAEQRVVRAGHFSGRSPVADTARQGFLPLAQRTIPVIIRARSVGRR